MSLATIILAVSSLLNFNISSFFLGEIRIDTMEEKISLAK